MRHYCVLGPGKAGSTWLYNVLLQSDAVARPSIKESYFFSKPEESAAAYERLFRSGPETVWFGDVSNQYYKSLSSIDNALRHYPDTLFIYLVRDPVDRFLSAWRFELKQGRAIDLASYAKEWDLSMFDDRSILAAAQERIPPGQLMVIRFDDIAARPEHILDTLSEVMGITFNALPEARAKNTSVQPRSRIAARLGRAVAQGLRKAGLLRVLQALKSNPMVTKLFYSNRPITVDDDDRALARTLLPETYRSDAPTGIVTPRAPDDTRQAAQ